MTCSSWSVVCSTRVWKHVSLLGDLQQIFIEAFNQKLEDVPLLGDLQQLVLGVPHQSLEAREPAE